MRADSIDQLLSSYLKQPVRASWEGSYLDALRGSFEGARLEFAGIATMLLPLQQVVLRADRALLVPGVPPRLSVSGPRVEIAVGQADVDRWLRRSQLPFRLELGKSSLVLHTQIAGYAVGELEAELEIVRGWFVLKPRRGRFMGVPGYVSLFRSYLPVPPLPAATRLIAVHHEPEVLRLSFGTDDFDESLTPGLIGRLRRRILPFQG